ncbi:Mov34/MPN/PAD-1 family protein [Staphylospora marina]|uniref:Mov34/MPN/PAD-1 family protein n=1 Tax=Staphylospora marina TaxID=2490858 RepID=UPI0013DE03E5|nr:Mov34/MPN/PAD-1 family protein [Staphylospora marina]
MRSTWLTIQSDVIHQVREYCLGRYPLEGYGFLAGKGPVITRFFPIAGESPCPCSLQFEPRACLETIKKIRGQGLDWIGVIHSHPSGDAWPTARDLAGWHMEHISFWILSLKHPDCPLRAFYLSNRRIIPVFYEIV